MSRQLRTRGRPRSRSTATPIARSSPRTRAAPISSFRCGAAGCVGGSAGATSCADISLSLAPNVTSWRASAFASLAASTGSLRRAVIVTVPVSRARLAVSASESVFGSSPRVFATCLTVERAEMYDTYFGPRMRTKSLLEPGMLGRGEMATIASPSYSDGSE